MSSARAPRCGVTLLGLALALAGCVSAPHSAPVDAAIGLGAGPLPEAPPADAASSAPSSPSPAIDLQGQIGVKLQAFGDLPAKGISLGFFFHGRPDEGRLDLMTPLGSQLAQAGWTPAGAWLRRAGSDAPPETSFGADLAPSPERFDSIDALSERVLGEAIPLQTLVHWMQGHADPARPSIAGPADNLEAGTFTQDGWLIDTREWPRRLQATRAASERLRGIQIKVYLDR